MATGKKIVGTTNDPIWYPKKDQDFGPWLDQVWNSKCDSCGHEGRNVHTTKNGMKLCTACANAANTDVQTLAIQKEHLTKEVRELEKKIAALKKTRDALAKEVATRRAEISAEEAKEGAVEILEDMRDLTSSL